MPDNDSPWRDASSLITVNVDFNCVGLKTKPSRLSVQVRPTDTIKWFKNHLKNSHDISGSLKDHAGTQLDRPWQMEMSLRDLGITHNSAVEMTSYKSYNRLQHSHPVTIYVESLGDLTIKVRSATDMEELRHIIQDKLGMLMEEQMYTQGGKGLIRRNMKVVSRCGCAYGRDKLTLKWQPRLDQRRQLKASQGVDQL